MAEVLGLLVTGPHSARAPSSGAYKLIHTMTQTGAVGLHVCNTTVGAVKIRLAVVEAGYSYADGDAPAVYQFWIWDKEIPPSPDINDWDMTIASLGIGDRLVIRTDTSGVTFCPHGIQI